MKYLFIIGLLFSSSVFAQSDMYNEVIQELNAKKAENAQKANAMREQYRINSQKPQTGTAVNQYNPDGKLTNDEVLRINQQNLVKQAQEEQRYQQQFQAEKQNKYLICMNNRAASTGKSLPTLAKEDQMNGRSICN